MFKCKNAKMFSNMISSNAIQILVQLLYIKPELKLSVSLHWVDCYLST